MRELAGIKVDQVCIGTCTNSSYRDLATVARILRGRPVHPGVSFIVSPGSRQVLEMIWPRDGFLADLLGAGARIMENACGFCIGNGHSPGPTGGLAAHLQPQLRGPHRHEGRRGLPGQPRDGRRGRRARGAITDPRDLGDGLPRASRCRSASSSTTA